MSDDALSPLTITAPDLLAFHRCQRIPYLNRHGSAEDKQDPSAYVGQLRQERQHHQQHIQVQFPGIEVDPTHPEGRSTPALMQQRIHRIYKAHLEVPLPGLETPSNLGDVQLRSQPDGLVWQGSDQDGHYTPVEIRASKRIKPDYELALAFHAFVLGQVQGFTPTTGWLVLQDGAWQTVRLRRWLNRIPTLIQSLGAVVTATEMPDVFMARSRCSLCPWQDFCREHSAQSDPLRLLPGVTRTRHPILVSAGITSIGELAQASVDQLSPLAGLGPKAAVQLVRQAQSTHSQKPVWIRPLEGLEGFDPWPQPVELCFDIEADPHHGVAYLLGVLLIRKGQVIDYHRLMAPDPAQEQQVWESFLTLSEQYPQAPIYHFHAFEVQTCRKLALKHGTAPRRLHRLLKRFVDLHQVVTHGVVLPIESYSLKTIARWLGFEWRLSESGGAQSIFWYAQWLETQDPHFLEWLATYNEDDCRATYRLKQWLAEATPPLALSADLRDLIEPI